MKRLLIGIVIIVVGIQLIPVNRTNPDVAYDFDGPDNVKAILKRSCYDCHSNETTWPWYSYVAPVSWLVAHDVREGRGHLNFSDWAPLDGIPYIRQHMFEMVSKGEMPPKVYLPMHSDAKITPEDLTVLKNWAGQ